MTRSKGFRAAEFSPMNVSKITYLANNNIALTTASAFTNKSFPENKPNTKDSGINIPVFHHDLIPTKELKRKKLRGFSFKILHDSPLETPFFKRLKSQAFKVKLERDLA